MVAKTQLIVLQDPCEVNHAKNTVRLLKLVMPSVQMVVGEDETDFADLRLQLSQATKPVYLLYPSDQSVNAQSAGIQHDCILLLLDGTWRKAFKMLQLNPWLKALPALHLNLAHSSGYRIRKANRSDSLSSLEAAAYSLAELDSTLDISPLLDVFDAMVNLRIEAMPSVVKRRYIEN